MTQAQAQIQQTSDNQVQKKNEKSHKLRFNIEIFNRCLLGIIIFMGVAYLFCVNDLAIKGFKMSELKKQVSLLNEENDRSELDAMSLKSYANVSDKVKKMNMVAVSKATYIEANSALVAKK